MPRTVAALALSSHPGPSLAVSAVSVMLGIAAGLDPLHVGILGVAFLLGQLSVGLSNDWIDAERDRAVGRTDKPVATGLVDVNTVRGASFATATGAILLTLPLGWRATLAHTLFIVSAWTYNLGLKNTPLSVLPYIASFGLLPLIATLARPAPAAAAAWALALGALLGVAAHFANVLPDFDDDARTGISGLPHRLGRAASGVVIWASLAAGAIVAFFGPGGDPTALQCIGLVLTALLAIAIAGVLRRPPTRLLFQLIIAAALVNVILLSFSGSRLLA
ncbi:UbiA family prenyltransferase [Frigoribacterium sp. CG_9.8]|uniref:UbiA family prenyltransferase n=1 Tax=Frigoribacterium sp. CG_9.8 TaxID=2787733 RepID=UPI0018C96E9D|nr:UbiA family prenyltransferase [Frigoribacterium sp. CG_9.8]MBG6107308.1 4-hydroxybenzoate polyprenyltransferase [Frigoribacterium sp. CG_9.8]